MRVLLISTYEMGRQPFGLASPAAWLRREGFGVDCVDLTRQKVESAAFASAGLIAFHLPMHTATRLAGPAIRRARAANPGARICAYGLYAPANETWLRSLGVTDVLGGEFEQELAELAKREREKKGRDAPTGQHRLKTDPAKRIPKLRFLVPDRSGLPPLAKYAALNVGGERRVAGYTEASRGCRHLCRHCPIVPVYQGQFRVVQPDVVLADVAAQVAAGASHITFGDPDFLNGPTHALRVIERLHEAFPTLTYDVTIKIEHLLRHRALLSRFRDTGCLFVTSAVESLDDRVLAILDKGHTRAGFLEAVELCRSAQLTLVPTFVAFHPWLTPDGYVDLLDTIHSLELVEHVAPIQLAIRLLIPEGSRLLELDDVRRIVEGFDPATLTYRWRHPDRAVDDLHAEIAALVGAHPARDRRATFDAIQELAYDRAGVGRPCPRPARDRATVPYLNEPWYC